MPICSNANRTQPSFCVSIHVCIKAMRGTLIAWRFTDVLAAIAFNPRAATDFDVAPSTINVPAGNCWSPTEKVVSATAKRAPEIFQGNAAARQSPVLRTTNVDPSPETAPVTTASASSGVIAWLKTEESATGRTTTWWSRSSVHPVSSYGGGSFDPNFCVARSVRTVPVYG